MKFLNFVGWSVIGLLLLSGLAYGLFPTIASMVIVQGLTNHGFTNVEINIDRPSTYALTIPSLSFRTPIESGSTSVIINNTEITYSLDSLLNRVVEAVNIEHMKIVWASSLLERPSAPSPSLPAPQTDSQFVLKSLSSGHLLPVLPFQHLRLNHVDISNPLAPPTLQQISLNVNMRALRERYEGFIHLEGDGLLLNLLTFSLTHNGAVSITGSHTNAPEDPMVDLKTSLERSASALQLQGKATLKLHPLIHTLAALYPLPPEYQSVTGTFSGTWIGTIHEQPSQASSSIGPIQGDFTLNAHMPSWPPFAQDIQLLTQGNFFVGGPALRVILQPSSAGSVNLFLDSLTPPSFDPFISHKGLRLFRWNIREPIHVVVPIKQPLDAIQIPTGKIHIAMHNASEQLDMRLSPHGLLWKPSSGVEGKGDVSISTHFKPALTPSLSLETLSLEAKASVALSASRIEVKLNPTSLLRFSNVKNETMHIPAMESRFPKGLSWTYHTKPQTWKLQAAASTLALPIFFLQDRQWKLGDILTKDLMMTATHKRWMINAETTITQLQPPFDTIKIPISDWQIRYSVNPTSMTVQFKGQTANA